MAEGVKSDAWILIVHSHKKWLPVFQTANFFESGRQSASFGLSDTPRVTDFGAASQPNGGKPPRHKVGGWLGCCVDLANRVQARTQGIGSDAWVLIVHPYRNPLPELQAADFLF